MSDCATLFFINSGHQTAIYNMSFDARLLAANEGVFLRVYGWSPPAVSIGFGQKAEKELDLDHLRADGIDCVKRLTGGRAVLHHKELTYSVAGPVGGMFGNDLNQTYKKIGEALAASLELLGVKCQLEKAKNPDERSRSHASLPCFASTARYELKVEGRKILGSAQKRTQKRFLQHGSLLLSRGLDIADYLNAPEHVREEYRRLVTAESTTVQDVMGKTVTFDQAAEAFRQGFSDAWGKESVIVSNGIN
ncbi:MAG: hypothetical protein A2487_06380 [Candidatus Raymondbacteria bacterium RifOxyC12_full_50_8]|uniref:BPL/LPL catalytic domain-containing protein n=1 Tax=Candidatus Raymondbacteria bacterium RIFOXYD12_FULL_49_13 TaxID=1817890 RepID=A0A1F7FC31_UNCRA|nr:MAG: hypothetical protein A2248_03280 [Candidatus Raymondbacteria bacterium RIFOXYA2_FULL_49_16]OGJ93279.1 MAG: hypothetical protein A2350_14515 [Candidatus Raymondbacteria bacterium RifOxyB12_full_50_8]OGK04239.1 MAG: hypothetical protein A2519_17925 [Candidatus Raymondbacteria bacterium RIFOXYD12_FULL_49_13]OGK06074.1 MAG: hypothetical protein A2487_06380 [Candidatus Raymondbacteria bacterium RifOxyC12_full_50_8]OGP42478.1 MAG: hypothetical protein A2324_17315 [Candidatus Raymondbacteria b